MSKNKPESMINFKYFQKLKKTKKKSATLFFSSFFSAQIPKKIEQRKYNMNIFRYKEVTHETPQEILINELKKPISEGDLNLLQLSSKKINNILNNSNNHYNMERNINTMLNIIKRNKKCLRYFILNSLTEKYLRLLLAFSTHEEYIKGVPIYKNNSKPNACYLVIRGKISLRTLNQEKIKNEMNKKNTQFLTLFKKIEIDDKFNGKYINEDSDKISIDNFISKTNIIIKQQDDNNIDVLSRFNKNKKELRKSFRRSFTKDPNIFFKELTPHSKIIVEDKILMNNLINLQRNLSCEVKAYTPGDFFGVWDLILDKPHQETAYAEENTDLLVLNKKYFDKYFLKQFIKIDNERRLFLTKRIDFLHINNVVNLKPEFYDKDSIIYTQFDYAKKFYIIYNGKGALKQMKNGECKKKGDVIFYKNDMKTLCLVDKGCVVGLEACKDGRKKYDNNFVILEDNTILYSFQMRGVNDDNYLKKKNRIQLKKELGVLYLTQNNFLPKTNLERKKMTRDEIKLKKKEDKINDLFFDAKDYYWRTILNQKKVKIKSKMFGNLNDIYNNNYYKSYYKSFPNKKSLSKINLKKTFSTEFNPNKIKIQNRNSNSFRYLTSMNNKHSKELSIFTFQDKEEESKKTHKFSSHSSNYHKLETLNLNSFSENSYNKRNNIFLKSNSISHKIKTYKTIQKNKRFLDLKYLKVHELLREEKNNHYKFFKKFNSIDNNENINDKKYNTMKNNKIFHNFFLNQKKKIKLSKNVVDKYIIKVASISNENNINYNSGYFKIPLIGS